MKGMEEVCAGFWPEAAERDGRSLPAGVFPVLTKPLEQDRLGAVSYTHLYIGTSVANEISYASANGKELIFHSKQS